MNGHLATGRALWRSWHGTAQAGFAAAGLMLIHVLTGPVEVPGRDDVAQSTWPLASAFLGLACLTGSRTAHRAGERITPKGASTVRAGYLAALALASACLLPLRGATADPTVLARNDALLCGAALLAVELLPAAAAWAPLVVLPMLTWLLGSNGDTVPPETWAVLLHPAGSSVARATASVVLATGAVVYVGRPLSIEIRRARLRRSAVSGARSG